MSAMSKRPAIVRAENDSHEAYAADQLVCGECDCDEWSAFHLAGTNISVLRCLECNAIYRAELAEVSDDLENARADYHPGNRGIYGGGDS